MGILSTILGTKNVTADYVITTLSVDMTLPTTILRSTAYVESKEAKVQNNLLKQLKSIYGDQNVQEQFSIGGCWGLKSDLDLFKGQIGIELKIAEQLKSAANVERLIGQVVLYTKNQYQPNNFIVLVVGKEKEYNSSMKEIENIVTKLGVKFVYKAIDNKSN